MQGGCQLQAALKRTARGLTMCLIDIKRVGADAGAKPRGQTRLDMTSRRAIFELSL